jgi:hypothetical protein
MVRPGLMETLGRRQVGSLNRRSAAGTVVTMARSWLRRLEALPRQAIQKVRLSPEGAGYQIQGTSRARPRQYSM